MIELAINAGRHAVHHYGGDDAHMNKTEFEDYIKRHGVIIPEDELKTIFNESDGTCDAKLNATELATLLGKDSFLYWTDIENETDVTPKNIKNQVATSWYERVLLVSLVVIAILTVRARMASEEILVREAGWLKLSRVIHRSMAASPVLKTIPNTRIVSKQGIKSEVFMDADATRVFKMVRQLDSGPAEENFTRATVWECEELETRKHFAVKRFQIDTENPSAAWNEFLAEMLPVEEKLEHDNIVGYENDFCLEVNRPGGITEIYILMEFLPGMSLFDVIQGRRVLGDRGDKRALRESETRQLLRPIAEALFYLHELPEPILHLDLNPANVHLNIIAKDGAELGGEDLKQQLQNKLINGNTCRHNLRVKLIDFGCATKLHKASLQDHFERNLTHLAPEQLSNATDQISRATDVFLFGELLYMCLLASPPFGDWPTASLDEEQAQAFKTSLRNGQFVKPGNKEHRCWDDLSKEAKTLLQKCLNAAPKERPQSIREVLDDPWWKMTSDPPERQSDRVAKPMLPFGIMRK